MEVSNKFSNINKNLEKLFKAICDNKIIAKYVYYLDHNPLSKPNVAINMRKAGYYFINFFDGNIPQKEQIRLFFNFLDANLDKQPLGTIVFSVEIVIPSAYWTLEGSGELRGINILDELSKTIDQQLGYGVREARIINARGRLIPNSNYVLMAANIIIDSSTMKGLR